MLEEDRNRTHSAGFGRYINLPLAVRTRRCVFSVKNEHKFNYGVQFHPFIVPLLILRRMLSGGKYTREFFFLF